MNNHSIITVSDELFQGRVTKEILGFCSVDKKVQFENKSHCNLLPKELFYSLKIAIQNNCPAVAFNWVEVTLARERQLGKWSKTLEKDKPYVFFIDPFPAFVDKIHFISSFYEVLLDFCDIDSEMHLLKLEKQIVQLSSLYELDYNSFIKAAKYMYAFPLAAVMKKTNPKNSEHLTHLPPRPPCLSKEGVQLRGPLRRLYRNRMVGRRAVKFAFTILQGVKRGCVKVADSLFASTFAKHILDLSAKPKIDIKDDLFTVPILNAVVDNIFVEDYENYPQDYWEYLMKKEISQSASFNYLRSLGGSRQEVIDTIGEMDSHVSGSIPIDEDSRNQHYVNYRVMARSQLHSMYEGKSNYSYAHISRTDVVNHSRNIHLIDREVMVAGIAEPLKVRVITKGDAMSNFYSAPIQNKMWSTLKKLPPFQLIGKVLTSSILHQLDDPFLGSEVWSGFKDFNLYVSGDYTAATDNLNVDVSKTIFSRICKILDPKGSLSFPKDWWEANLFELDVIYPKVFREMFHETWEYLLQHQTCYQGDPLKVLEPFLQEYVSRMSYGFDPYSFEYIDITIGENTIGINHLKDSPVRVTMQNGQLMGSVLSFPILCIANFSCYLESLLMYAKSHVSPSLGSKAWFQTVIQKMLSNIDRLPVLINGDDIAFKTNNQHYLIWESTLKKYGFSPSQGKNYVSPNLVTINSQMFQMSVDQNEKRSYREIFYLNVGLLRGPNSGLVGERRDILTDMPLSDFYSRSVLASANPQRSHRRFIHYNRNIISRITKGGQFNLFASTQLLGLGFKNIHLDTGEALSDVEIPVYFTPRQLTWAGNLEKKIKSTTSSNQLRKIPSVTFSKDDALATYAFHSSTNKNVVVSSIKPYDVLTPVQLRMEKDTMPGLFQPGVFVSNQQSTNGHYILPKEKDLKTLDTPLSSKTRFSKTKMIEFRRIFVKIVGSESWLLTPKTVSSQGEDLSEPYQVN